VVDPCTTSVQWSRRLIVLEVFLALAQHGRQIAWMSDVRLGDGAPVACVTSFRTTESDSESVVREMSRLAVHEPEVTT
jgi:hypothetical protein